jgi:Holliday junction DNA helicase RuvA
MIRSLNGVVESLSPDSLVLAVGPVSLRIFVPAPTLATIGSAGQKARLFTHLQVREDQWSLYGFSTEEQRSWFEMLLGVNGVGPRVALSILSVLPLENLRQALSQGDPGPLTRVPGVGKKVAGRLVLELQGKVGPVEAGVPMVSLQPELVDALTNLGYPAADAQIALQAVPGDQTLAAEDRLLSALRYLASR